MKNKTAACSECPRTYELVPPADLEYNEPHEKATSDDFLKRVYECENGHLNTIYWEKRPFIIASSEYKTEAMRNRDIGFARI